MSAVMQRLVKAPEVRRGLWLLLPSGKHVEVSAVKGESHSQVTLRYLDDEGTVSTGCFDVRLDWIVTYAKVI